MFDDHHSELLHHMGRVDIGKQTKSTNCVCIPSLSTDTVGLCGVVSESLVEVYTIKHETLSTWMRHIEIHLLLSPSLKTSLMPCSDMTTGWHGLHRAAPNQTFVTSTISTILADAKICADDCSATRLVELLDKPENMSDPETAVAETPLEDGLGTI